MGKTMAKFINKFERASLEAGYVWTNPDLSYPTEADSEWFEWEGESRSLCVEEWPDGQVDYLLVSRGKERRGENPSTELMVDIWEWLYS
jgi:hypothetical protein